MGRPKALLTLPSGQTFVRQLATSLLAGGVADVLIVGRPDDMALRAEVESLDHACFVVNAHAEEGQLSSVIAGLNAADRPGVAGVLITPVDLPLIAAPTVRALVSAFLEARPPVARTRYRGRHGHPAIFARAVFDALRRADPSVGAKSVIREREGTVLDVDVDDPGVVGDVDTPEDYARLDQQ
jgi:molybdenum cofactor cytidylyltransferase